MSFVIYIGGDYGKYDAFVKDIGTEKYYSDTKKLLPDRFAAGYGLYWAASEICWGVVEKGEEAFSYLLDQGGDPNQGYSNEAGKDASWYILDTVCEPKAVNMLWLLIAKGAKPRHALFSTLSNSMPDEQTIEIIGILLSNGADIHVLKNNKSVLDWAFRPGYAPQQPSCSNTILRYLYDHGARVHDKRHHGYTDKYFE